MELAQLVEEQNLPDLITYSLLALTFLALAFLILSSTHPQQVTKTLSPPPSPPLFPFIGNFHQLGSCAVHRSLAVLSARCGPLMLLHLGRRKALVVSSAHAASEVLKTHDISFSGRPKSTMSAKLLYNFKDVATAPYGEYWRQMRAICVLQLLSTKKVQSFKRIREEEIALMIENIKELSPNWKPLINMSETLISLTNDIICRAALGRKYAGKDFEELLKDFVHFLGEFYIGDFLPWLNWMNRITGFDSKVERVAKELDMFLEQVVQEHVTSSQKTNNDDKDFVDVLLEVQRETKTGFSIDMTSIKAIILDIFSAGTHTTFTVLEWAMSELLRHPESLKKLQEEVRSFAKLGTQDLITEDDLGDMYYLKAVIKETMRLHPPLPLLFARESTRAVMLEGYSIEPETMVFVNAWAIGRDPKTWTDPDIFMPERFLNSSIDYKGHDFELIPFGAGRRGCPGIMFAMVIAEVALANLVYSFDWALPGGGTGEDLDMAETTGVTTHRKNPLMTIATPKNIKNSKTKVCH